MPRPNWQLLSSLVVSLWFAANTGAVEFASPSAYAVGSSPQTIVVGDFNADGKLDLAVLNAGSNNVSILLGNGDGTFQAAKNFVAGASPSGILAADFNGDGKLDLAVFMPGNTANSTSGEVRILLGNGDGTFQAPVATTLTPSALTLAAGDFNGDKKADVIIGSSTTTSGTFTLQVALGNGDGTFQAAKNVGVSGLKSSHFAVADFNKDGKLDLVVDVGGVAFVQGNGDGTFAAPSTPTHLALGTASNFWVADFNNDGNLDLIVSSAVTLCISPIIRFCGTSQNVGVLLGSGNGGFAAEQVFAQGRGSLGFNSLITSIQIGDFNGDGRLDVLYRQGRLTGLQVRLGKGDGTFATAIPLAGSGLVVAAAQDFNGDKLTDLALLDPANGNVDVVLNDSPATGTDLGIITSSASPEPVGVGQKLTYTADVMNEGPKDATGVSFTDTLPANVSFVSATASSGTCTQTKAVVTCSIGALADTADVSITIVVTPTAPETATNDMSVSGNESDLASANNSAAQNSTVLPVYTLTVTKSGNGTGTVASSNGISGTIGCGATCSATFLSGTVVNVSAGPDANSLLQSWGGACAGTPNNQSCSITMNADAAVSAVFVLGITLNVSITGGGTGTVTSSDGSISCTDTGGNCSSLNLPGTTVTLAAMPSGGSQFSSWSGACTGTNPNSCSVALNSNQTVSANIAPAPTFSVTPSSMSLFSSGGGVVTDVIMLAGQNGFSGAISLTCSVIGTSTPVPTCALSPARVTAAASAVSSTLSVNVPSHSTLLTRPRAPFRLPASYAMSAALAYMAVALLWFLALVKRGDDPDRALRLSKWILGGSLATVVLLLGACGGSSTPPQPQSFTVNVMAISGSISKTTQIQLTVH